MHLLKTVRGDITKITDVQAIVNAANNSLLGGGVTKAYHLPCKYVIHTVGPIWNGGRNREEELLASCYDTSMQLALEHGIRSIAFPSIATGVYRFPVDLAAKIAVDTVSRFLDEHKDDFDLVEWVLFDEHTKSVYEAVIK